jgi:hypothetical protein
MSRDMRRVFQGDLLLQAHSTSVKLREFLKVILLLLETLEVYHLEEDELHSISLATDIQCIDNLFRRWQSHGIRYSTEAVCNGLEFIGRNFQDVLDTTLDYGGYLQYNWHHMTEINSWAYADIVMVHPTDISTVESTKIMSSPLETSTTTTSLGDTTGSDLKFGVRSEITACQINCFINIWDLGVDTLLGCPVDSKNSVIAFVSAYKHNLLEDFTSAKLIQVQSHRGYFHDSLTKFVFSHRMVGYAGFIPIDMQQRIVLADKVNMTGVDTDNPWVVFNAVSTIDRLILLDPSFKRRNYARDIMKERLTVTSNIWH